MRRVAAAAAAAALVAAPAAAAARPVVVRATIAPRAALFADPVVAQVDVLVDPRIVDPSKTRLSVELGAWTQAGPTRVGTQRAGDVVRRRWQLVLACRSDACAPAGTARLVRPPVATMTLVRRDGTTLRRAVHWPAQVVASRIPAGSASASPPPFVLQTAPPPARTWVGASTAGAVLDAAAGVLAAAAFVLAGLALHRRRGPAVDPRSPLERALALAREAEARPAPDRRRALALLARVSGGRDAGYAADAASAAWRPDAPSTEHLAELVVRGERLEEDA